MTAVRDCMSDRIKKIILERICNGTYLPGDRLVELQIARELDVSQAPIREALCQLEAMRVVETEPYKGTRVREIPDRELRECIQIRSALEMLAAEQAQDQMPEYLPCLREKARATVLAAKEKNVQAYTQANLEFHRAIVEASGNETLLMVWDSLAPELRMSCAVRANVERLPECADDHLEIVEAFEEGEYRLAGRLLKKHTALVLTQKFLAKEKA